MAKSLDLQVILAARDKITGPLKKINTTSTATARALKQSQQEIKQLKASQRDVSSFKKLDRSIQDNSKSLNDAQNRVRQLGNELKNTSKPTAALRMQYNKARQEVEKFTGKGQQQRKELGKIRSKLKDAGISARNLSDEEKRLADRMANANDKIQRQKRYLDQLGKSDVGGKFNNMTSEVGKFGRRALFATGGAAAGIFGVANSTASLGDEIAKTGDKIGIALGPLQELRYAAERSGVSTQKFDSSLERYVKRLGEATQGNGAAKKAYDELGLSADELSRLTPEKSLGIVADRLSKVENQSQRVAIAAQLFGREGVAMVNMMKDGSAGLQALRKDARATGYVLSDKAARDAETFKDSLLDAQLGLTGMKNTIGAELMPAVTELMGDLSGWMRENKDQVKAFATNFGTRLKSALPILRDLAVGAASTAKTLGMITSNLAGMVGGFDNLGMILAFVFAMKPVLSILAFGKAIFSATSAVVGLAGGLPAIAAGIKAITAALIANPIGLIIAAIAGAGYLIYKNWDGIAEFFTGLWAQVKQEFKGGLLGMSKLILDWSPFGLFYKAFSKVLSWFGIDLPDTFSGFGEQILNGLIGGLTGGLKKVKDTIVNAGKETIGWFKDVLGIKSPSRVFMAAGHDTLEGYRKGLEQKEPDTLKQVNGFGKRVRQAGAGIAIGVASLPAAANGVQFDARPPVAAQAPAASQSGGDYYTFNVYAAPGQSAEEVAAQIQRVLEDRDRRKATRARSALYDRD